MPAPRKFSREQLQAAALALVDEGGLGALTMRSLAARLGTGPMTIYNYVEGREGLEELVTEAVMAEAAWEADPSHDWRRRVHAVAEGMWRAVRAHPAAVPLILTRRGLDPGTLRPAEALLEALAAGGRSGADLLAAFRVVQGFVAGLAQAELGGDAQAAPARVAALPPADFPHLIEMAGAAGASDPEQEFHAGMRIIIAGLGGDRPTVRR
ncbi:TetR/AcrR family transcriptional regulator [Spirillospora sp. NPDC050679]